MDADEMSRRRFLGGAATAGAAVAWGGLVEPGAMAHAAQPGDPGAPATGGLPARYFSGPGADIPKLGLRWAFSATVFFADRVMINTMESAAGRGYTSVGGGEIWGPRLQGRVLPHSGADYYKTSFNTFYMFEAADGALIFIHNRGSMRRFAAPYEPGKPLEPPPPGNSAATGTAATSNPSSASTGWTRFRATPMFTAPKGPHDWLNHTVFVANSQRQANPDHTVFTYYEVL